MKSKIENITDLRLELARLEFQANQKEAMLAYHAKSIMNKFHTPMKIIDKLQSWFGGGSSIEHKEKPDWVSNAFQFVLPLALDKIFFQKSSFIVKTLAAIATKNAATLISKDTVAHFVNNISDWVKRTKVNREEKNNLDFGIPPDSETY